MSKWCSGIVYRWDTVGRGSGVVWVVVSSSISVALVRGGLGRGPVFLRWGLTGHLSCQCPDLPQ